MTDGQRELWAHMRTGMAMHDWRNSEIITGDVGESRHKARTHARTPQSRTKYPVTRPVPRSSLPHCTVRCHGNALRLYHDPNEGHSKPSVAQFSLALGQVLNMESVRFENRSRHRRPSLRFFVVFVRCSRLMLGSYLTLSHDHFPAHSF